MYRGGLDRFKKAESLEPFSVSTNAGSRAPAPSPPVPTFQPQASQSKLQIQTQNHANSGAAVSEAVTPNQQVTQVGGGQSTWQPPDWAIEPRPGVYYLEVLKDGQVLDRINLDRRRHIFGRQQPTCDFVLDHQSVSRQHAAVVPHRNGSIYVIDLGSVHGTFVANERLQKDIPVELEVGQSLKFAASTRTYILRKNTAALFPTPTLPAEINLPSPPDPSDEEAVLAYNTILNRYGLRKSDFLSKSSKDSGGTSTGSEDSYQSERTAKKRRKARVAFKDQVGGELVQIVGISDGADVETEPGPIGVKEGSLVGKYESLVHITVIPKGKEQISQKEGSVSPKGVTDKLQQVLNKVKSIPKGGAYDGLYGDSFSGMVGTSWAYSSGGTNDGKTDLAKGNDGKIPTSTVEKHNVSLTYDDDDDLFGD
ncbi:hypothetical protein Taro_036671 [Colocasia esculenta]|uniref:FHA domain-containing protein n=1 Tax=Colocasia esculenta TaxID=4460 RepID=A0A843WII5_COLES|nr:hypothetical protein [Colocasia esculenta]